jgi:hypothetical protein
MVEQRGINKLIESIARWQRGIEEVKKSLHIRTPTRHGGRKWKRGEMSSNGCGMCSNQLGLFIDGLRVKFELFTIFWSSNNKNG